jgi:hypothetical protein
MHSMEPLVGYSLDGSQNMVLFGGIPIALVRAGKSTSSRWRSPRPNPVINSAGLDETLAWGALNFQSSPEVDARRSEFLS